MTVVKAHNLLDRCPEMLEENECEDRIAGKAEIYNLMLRVNLQQECLSYRLR